MKRFNTIYLGIVAVLVLGACLVWYLSRPAPAPLPIRNVLLISLDTTRADHLGCYGYPDDTTPHLDALADEGTRFANVISPVPLTLPAHSSLLTGTNPPRHGVRQNFDYKLDESAVTLAEILKENGMSTAAIVAADVLAKKYGLVQGFDTYDDDLADGLNTIGIQERRAGDVSRLADEWLKSHQQDPFFLLLHYYDPHDTYEPPEPFASQFADHPYAGEIAYADDCIGQVIATLKDLKLYDSTLIIVTADHGEMNGEHGEETHSFFIYQSAVKVPLICRLPGQHSGKVVDSLVGLIDIMPTICGLLGQPIHDNVEGIDLSGHLLSNKEPPDQTRFIYCESLTPTIYGANSLLGIVTCDGWKYIDTSAPELYNIQSDPGEVNNLITDKSDQAEMLEDELRVIAEESSTGGTKNSSDPNLRHLQSLGYVGGSVDEAPKFDRSKENPHQLVAYHNGILEANHLFAQGKKEEVKTICENLSQRRPDQSAAFLMLGRIAISQQDYQLAEAKLREALRCQEDNAMARYFLGMALQHMGQFAPAIELLRAALQQMPGHAEAHFNLGLALQVTGEISQAIDHYRAAIKLREDYADPRNNLAWILATHPDPQIRNPAEAVQLVQRANDIAQNQNAGILDTLSAAHAAAPAETASFVDRIHRFGVKVFANFHNEVVPEGSSFDLVTDNADGSRDNFVSNIQQYVVAHNYDGVWFNVEWSDQLPPWVGHNQIMGELDNALGGSYEILSDVFIHRGELGAVGLPHVDAITMMSYNSFGEAITFPDYWTNRGAANDQLTMGMSTGWNSFGLNPADAYNRVVYALNNNMTGVFLFGFDSEDDATSMLRGVRDALFDNAPAASVTITQTGGSPTVNENGPTSVGYQIVLGTAPTSTVTITVDPDGETEVNGEGAGNVATLTFNSFDWNIAHWVFVRAVVDADVEVNPHLSIIRHTASSADPDYSGIGIANVLVNVLDLGPLTPGDANGDGSVNGLDFGVWETNQFTTDTVWSTGDFNHDGVTDIRAFNMWNANKFLVSALAGSDEAAGQAASRQPRAALSAPSPNRLSVGIAAVAGQSQLGIDRRLAERIEKFQHGAEASVVHSWEPLDRLWTLFDPWQDGLDRDRARWKIGGQVEVDESVTDEVFARRTASIPLFQTA